MFKVRYPLFALLISHAALAETVFYEDFESGVLGEKPSAPTLRPSGDNTGADAAFPVVVGQGGALGVVVTSDGDHPGNASVGSGNYVRLYDYDTKAPCGMAYNFADSAMEAYSAVHFSFDFAVADPDIAGNDMRITVGEYYGPNAFYLHSGARRAFMLSIFSEGRFALYLDNEGHNMPFDPSVEHKVDVYVNDLGEDSFTMTGPDSNEMILYPNSVTVFLDDEFVGQGILNNRLNYRGHDANLSRVSIFTNTSAHSMDTLFDNLRIDTLSDPDLTTVNWPEGAVPSDPVVSDGGDFEGLLLSEAFEYPDASLQLVSRWDLLNGESAVLIENELIAVDYSLNYSASEACLYRMSFNGATEISRNPGSSDLGPAVYVKSTLQFDSSVIADLEAPIFTFLNPDISDLDTGWMWVKSVDGGFVIGASTDLDASSVSWSSTVLSMDEDYDVVWRYSLATNDSKLWINPESVDSISDIEVSIEGDSAPFYAVNAVGIIAQHGQEGKLQIDNMKIAGSMDEVLSPIEVVEREFSLQSNTSGYSVDGPTYTANFAERGAITRVQVNGQDFIGRISSLVAESELDLLNSGELGSSRMFGPRNFVVHSEYWMQSISFSDDSFTTIIQNNSTVSDVYSFHVNPDVVRTVKLGDGVILELDAFTGSLETTELLLCGFDTYLIVDSVDRITTSGEGESRHFVIEKDLAARTTTELGFYMNPLGLISPTEYRVFQRQSRTEGVVELTGWTGADVDTLQVRFSGGDTVEGSLPEGWIDLDWENQVAGTYHHSIDLPAGGWYSMEMQALKSSELVFSQEIQHIGIGEVFIGAGQSNSTNSGTEATQTNSGKVVSFSGGHWQIANDPQPGNHGWSSKGSYYPAFGDYMVEEYGVPIAIASTGHGGTPVERWQPDYNYNYDEYLYYGRYNGLHQWTSHRIQQLGANGIRAVLWHQGESDSSHTAGQVRTPENEYYNDLKTIIESSRINAGWSVPWFVAQTSVWPLEDENPGGDENIYRAQQRLWEDGIAYEGANSDSLGLEYRQPDGSRVHFTPLGLSAHGALWLDHVGEVLDDMFNMDELLGEQGYRIDQSRHRVEPFGDLVIHSAPWLYHSDIGWFYVSELENGFWVYDPIRYDDYGWLWSSVDTFPWLYSDITGGWVYYYGIQNDSFWIYDYDSQSWNEFPVYVDEK